MNITLQQLKGKTKVQIYKIKINYYDEMKIINFRFEGDPFDKNVRGISKIYHEAMNSVNVLQTKPLVRIINLNFFDWHYAVIKNRDHKEIVNDEIESNENYYINFDDFITPNHNIGRKKNIEKLK